MLFKIEDENIAEKEIREKKEKKEKELTARLPDAVESISISSIPDTSTTSYGDWVYKPGTITAPLGDLTCHIEAEPVYATAEEFSKKVVRVIREEAADEAACAARSRAREALEDATKKEREKYLVKKSEKEEAEDKKKLDGLDVDGVVAAAAVRGAQLGAARVIQAIGEIVNCRPVSKDLDDIIDALGKIVREMNLNGKVKCAPGTGATAYWFDEDEKKDEKEKKRKTKEK